MMLKTVIVLLCFVGVFCEVSQDFYSFTVKDVGGNDFKLDELRGKVTLVVNVASLCGFTEEHYDALTKLDSILGHDGYFRVLAFPCNQFGEQEPGTNEEIVRFAVGNFGAEFPIFGKVDVVGDTADKAFKNLYQQSGVIPEWNFYKYLVNHEGKVIGSWGPKVSVESIFPTIQAAVRAAAAADTEGEVPKKNFKFEYKIEEKSADYMVDPDAIDYDVEDVDVDADMSQEHLRDEL